MSADQLKILTTAMFSVVLLGKKLTFNKWVALGLLFVGVALVQMPTGDAAANARAQATAQPLDLQRCI